MKKIVDNYLVIFRSWIRFQLFGEWTSQKVTKCTCLRYMAQIMVFPCTMTSKRHSHILTPSHLLLMVAIINIGVWYRIHYLLSGAPVLYTMIVYCALVEWSVTTIRAKTQLFLIDIQRLVPSRVKTRQKNAASPLNLHSLVDRFHLFATPCAPATNRGRRKRLLIIEYGSKRSYHRNQNDHDPDKKFWITTCLIWSCAKKITSSPVWYDAEQKYWS